MLQDFQIMSDQFLGIVQWHGGHFTWKPGKFLELKIHPEKPGK